MADTNKITGRDNPRLKFAKRVRDGKEKGAIFVEGVRLAEEALRSRISVRECFVATRALTNERVKTLVESLNAAGIVIHELSAEMFRSISDTENAQGILLICEKPEQSRKTFEKAIRFSTGKIPLILFLEEVNNPSNLGAIVRTAEAAGASGVIVSRNSADAFSPKSLRGSMGSAFRVPIWAGADLNKAIEWANERKITVTAADVDGNENYTQIDWKTPRLLVFGSEGHGLADAEKEKIDDLIRISIDANVESLNLAVSAGVILFEARRQLTD